MINEEAVLKEIKLETEITFFNTIYQQEVTGFLRENYEGTLFLFDRIVGDTEEGIEIEPVELLLTTEAYLDEEDVLNVNEIMYGNNLTFVKYKGE